MTTLKCHCERSEAISVTGASLLRRQLVGLQHQTLDPAAVLQMGLDDLVNVLLALEVIPDALGVDHHVGAVLAPVETAGGVEADLLNAELAGFLARIAAQLVEAAGGFRAGHAAAARMTLRPHIVAHEDMPLVEEPRVVCHSVSPYSATAAGLSQSAAAHPRWRGNRSLSHGRRQ